jgi:pyruvate dehydrogenase E1 component alpha subunit
MRDCVARARAGDGPSLIEAITYRLGAHTTADDPNKYRPAKELQEWQGRDPIPRYRTFLMERQLLGEKDDEQLREETRAEVQAAVDTTLAKAPQAPLELFEHVYATLTPQLRQQQRQLLQELDKGAA